MNLSLLDTDTLSYVFARDYPGVADIARQYRRVFHYFSISVTTVSEVVSGFERVKDFSSLRKFHADLPSLELLPLDVEEALLAGQITGRLDALGLTIGKLDPFIAATAIVNDRVLVTNNQKHYQRIVDLGFPLQLDNWLKESEAL